MDQQQYTKYHEGQATQALRTNIQWLKQEIHEMLQLYRISKSSDCAVYISVVAMVDVHTWNMADRNKPPMIKTVNTWDVATI